MTSDVDVLRHISALVDEEHDLRERRERDELEAEAERRRLEAIEVELDRCWDLLRQRRALRDVGQDPDRASTRSGEQVEGYLG
jgi:predicted nuclease with TOPRIM domain